MTAAPHRGLIGVIDDDEAVRDSLQFLLETAGHAVRTYGSGLELVRDQTQDGLACLVLDQHMPGMNGLDALAALQGRGVNTPALLLTGALSPEVSRRAAELGVRTVLEKPLAGEQLLADLGAVLGAPKAPFRTAPPRPAAQGEA